MIFVTDDMLKQLCIICKKVDTGKLFANFWQVVQFKFMSRVVSSWSSSRPEPGMGICLHNSRREFPGIYAYRIFNFFSSGILHSARLQSNLASQQRSGLLLESRTTVLSSIERVFSGRRSYYHTKQLNNTIVHSTHKLQTTQNIKLYIVDF